MHIEMIERPLTVNNPVVVCRLFLKNNIIVSTVTVDLQRQRKRFGQSLILIYIILFIAF